MEKLKHLIPHPKRPSQFSHDSLHHWVVAFVVCTFNVDVGPEIELVYPPETNFSASDLTAICFNSFPETQDAEVTDDLVFHFTLRNNSHDIKLSSPCSPHGSPSDFHCSAIFRQEHDRTSKRNFNQKTLVLVSNHNLPAFFFKLLRRMTTSGLISDPTTLEAACSQIAAWPPPSVGRHELPFLGSLLLLEIAPHFAFPLQGLSTPVSAFTSSSAIYAYEPIGSWSALMRLMPSLSELYIVFEKLLLCENIAILAKNPQTCSQFCSALIDLIRPIPYAGETRPYITMQSDFFTSGSQGGTPDRFVVGITNPFLLQRLSAVNGTDSGTAPHILCLQNHEQSIPVKREKSLRHRNDPGFDIPGAGRLAPPATTKKYLKVDSSFVQQLESMLKDESTFEEIGPFVRRHFAELTAQFLAPFSRYFAASMSSSVATPGGNLAYANFSEADFLQSLSKHGTSAKFRGQNHFQRHRARDALYGSFCRSPNFYSWLEMKFSLEKEASAGVLG